MYNVNSLTGWGGKDIPKLGANLTALASAVQESVAGTTASTDIPVPGLTAASQILSVLAVTTATGAPVVPQPVFTYGTAADAVQSTTVTTGMTIFVKFAPVPPASTITSGSLVGKGSAKADAVPSNAAATAGYTADLGGIRANAVPVPVQAVAPVANFTDVIAARTLTFTDTTTGTPYEWTWDFGDGLLAPSHAQNPVYTYTAAGTYSVTLMTTDSNGSQSSVVKPITVV